MDQSDKEYQKLPPNPWPQFSLLACCCLSRSQEFALAQLRDPYRSLALQQT